MACQWSGVAMTTASRSLRSISLRKSRHVSALPPTRSLGLVERRLTDVAQGRHLHVLVVEEGVQQLPSPVGDADEAEPDAVIGSQHLLRLGGGQGEGRGGPRLGKRSSSHLLCRASFSPWQGMSSLPVQLVEHPAEVVELRHAGIPLVDAGGTLLVHVAQRDNVLPLEGVQVRRPPASDPDAGEVELSLGELPAARSLRPASQTPAKTAERNTSRRVGSGLLMRFQPRKGSEKQPRRAAGSDLYP